MSITPISNIGLTSRQTARRKAIPASGAPVVVGADSNGDRTNDAYNMQFAVTNQARYGMVWTYIAAHFGWNIINENYIPNGSFEPSVWVPQFSGVDNPNGFLNCTTSAQTVANTLNHGADSLRLFANTTGTGMYAIVGGAAPAILTAPAPSGGSLPSAPTIFYAGRDMVAPVLDVANGTGCVLSVICFQGLITSVRVDAGGTGYTNGVGTNAVTVNANSITSNIGAHGSGATFTATAAGGAITSVAVNSSGSGYPDTPYWQGVPSNGAGSGPSGFMYINPSGQCTQVTLPTPGSGLTAVPNVMVMHSGPRYRNDSNAFLNRNLGLPVMVAGEVWTLSGWVSGVSITGGNLYLQAVASWPGSNNGVKQNLAIANASGTPATATQISCTFTVPAGMGNFEIRFGTSGGITNVSSQAFLDSLSLVRGTVAPPIFTDQPTARGGYASQTFCQAPGGFNLTANINVRLARHATAQAALLFPFINDLGSASGATAVGNRVTLATLSADLDTVLTAINAMALAPLVVVMGLPPWQVTSWPATPPPGYRDYYAFAEAMELLIANKCAQYGAIYVPLRKYFDASIILTVGQSNQVHVSQNAASAVADIVIAYIEGRLT